MRQNRDGFTPVGRFIRTCRVNVILGRFCGLNNDRSAGSAIEHRLSALRLEHGEKLRFFVPPIDSFDDRNVTRDERLRLLILTAVILISDVRNGKMPKILVEYVDMKGHVCKRTFVILHMCSISIPSTTL